LHLRYTRSTRSTYRGSRGQSIYFLISLSSCMSLTFTRYVPEELKTELSKYINLLSSMGIEAATYPVTRPITRTEAAVLCALARALLELLPIIHGRAPGARLAFTVPGGVKIRIPVELGVLEIDIPAPAVRRRGEIPFSPLMFFYPTPEYLEEVLELARQYLKEKHGIEVSPETLRECLITYAGLGGQAYFRIPVSKKDFRVMTPEVFVGLGSLLGKPALDEYVNYYVGSRVKERLRPLLETATQIIRDIVEAAKRNAEYFLTLAYGSRDSYY